MAKYRIDSRLAFVLAALFFAFLYGFAASQFRWFPHSILSPALDQAAAVDLPPHHMYPARHDLVGVVTYDEVSPDHSPLEDPGLTLLTSYWAEQDWSPGLRLIDSRGEVLHTWPVDVRTIWPGLADPSRWTRHYVHGSHLFDNGDVLFNVEYVGLVRMSVQGEVLWSLGRPTHHSIHRNDAGNFWVSAVAWLGDEDTLRRFPGLTPPLAEDRILEVSPRGEVVRELSVLETVFNSEHRSRLWSKLQRTGDVLHLNDVEELPESMADQYPLFDAGDVVVSLKHIDLVLVLDPDTGQIKWSAFGPFTAQHDPDFIGDGWISIFDNRSDGSLDGRFLGGSRLLAIQPHTGGSRQIYPSPESASEHERPFYTSIGGKAQLLPNGHWVITESQRGRVFEVDETGRTVWEWGHQRHEGGQMVSEVLEGTRYARSILETFRR